MASFVLFEAAGRSFALPAAEAVQVLRMAAVAPVAGAPPHLLGILNLRGALVPVVDARVRAGAAPRPPRPEDQLLVARAGDALVALAVDRVREVVDLPEGAEDGGASWRPAAPLARGAIAVADGAVVVQDAAAWLADARGAA